MNKRERREQYLSTRRPAEYLAERKNWQEHNKKWKAMCSKYDLDGMTVQQRWDTLVQEGFIDPNEFPKPM